MTIVLIPIDTVPVSNFNREVMNWLPMVPVFEVEYRLKQAVRDFCRITQIWQQRNTTLLTSVVGQEEYPADLPDGTELVAVLSAFDGETPLTVEAPGGSECHEPGATSGETTDWTIGLLGTDTIRVTPLPSVAGKVIKGTIVLAPNEDAEDLPKIVWQRWRTPIAHGCIAKLMAQVGKPWSRDLVTVQYHQDLFDDGAAECATKTGPRNPNNPLTVRIW